MMAMGMLTISNETNFEGWFDYLIYFAKTTFPIFSGILVLGLVLSLICYFFINYIIEIFKKNKLKKGN